MEHRGSYSERGGLNVTFIQSLLAMSVALRRVVSCVCKAALHRRLYVNMFLKV